MTLGRIGCHTRFRSPSELEGEGHDWNCKSQFSFGRCEPQQNCDFQHFPGTDNINCRIGSLLLGGASFTLLLHLVNRLDPDDKAQLVTLGGCVVHNFSYFRRARVWWHKATMLGYKTLYSLAHVSPSELCVSIFSLERFRTLTDECEVQVQLDSRAAETTTTSTSANAPASAPAQYRRCWSGFVC